MSKVKPPAPRFQSERTTRGVRLTLRRRWTPLTVFLVVFLGAWLGGWAVGEVTAIRQLVGGDSGEGSSRVFVAFWLVAWTAGGLFALYAWLWNTIGREVVEVGGGSLVLEKVIGPIKRRREFELEDVSDLRAAGPSPWSTWNGWAFLGIGAGTLAFDYGSKTYRFGDRLDEAEGKQVVKALEPHLSRAPAEA